ncbi:MAG: phosphatase PAP2 family protein [Ignavibacteriae bacterium]|nr:phosphatase PAP2 family protein [Ignavibacteriota bacterium]
MIEFFYSIDLFFFHLCNSWIANPVMDAVMPFVTEVKNFYAVYVLLFVWLLWRGGKKGRICAAVLAAAVLIADPLNSRFIKELFERQRPCQFLDGVRLLVPCGGGKSFPSTHAVNNFKAELVISAYFPKARWLVYSIATLVAFSRVYVGVHYPSDVIGGAIEGMLLGVILIMIADMAERYIGEKMRKNKV